TSVARGQEPSFFQQVPIVYTPVVDDRPYYYQQDPSFVRSHAGGILLRMLAIVCALAFALIVVPLIVSRRGGGTASRAGAARALAYFAAIGLGFIFVEIGLIQKLILYLGHPSYSI